MEDSVTELAPSALPNRFKGQLVKHLSVLRKEGSEPFRRILSVWNSGQCTHLTSQKIPDNRLNSLALFQSKLPFSSSTSRHSSSTWSNRKPEPFQKRGKKKIDFTWITWNRRKGSEPAVTKAPRIFYCSALAVSLSCHVYRCHKLIPHFCGSTIQSWILLPPATTS